MSLKWQCFTSLGIVVQFFIVESKQWQQHDFIPFCFFYKDLKGYCDLLIIYMSKWFKLGGLLLLWQSSTQMQAPLLLWGWGSSYKILSSLEMLFFWNSDVSSLWTWVWQSISLYLGSLPEKHEDMGWDKGKNGLAWGRG